MPDFYRRSIVIPKGLFDELSRIASLHETTVEEVVKKFFRFGLLASHKDLEHLTFHWRDGEEADATMWGEEGYGTNWEDMLDR